MIKKMLENKWLELILRWVLGLIFIFASIHKITEPESFAKIIYGYKLFPGELINLFAILLPFIELISGLALIVGFWPRSAAIVINGMLLAFIIAISINLIRGHEFDCGCFSTAEAEYSLSAVQLLIRDIAWFFMGLFVIFYKDKRKFTIFE